MPAILDDTLTLDQLKDDPRVLEVYQARARFGNNGKYELAARCPLHSEDTASCTLSQDRSRWLWYCFGCGHGGSIVDFIMQCDHLLEGAAIQKLKQELGHDGERPARPEPKPPPTVKAYVTRSLAEYAADEETALASNQAAKDWLLNERGITSETARRLHFGFQQSIPKESRHKQTWDVVDQGWITFACIDGDQVVLEKYRSLARKVFTRRVGMRSTLFNTQTAAASGDLYLVSGDFDAAVMEQAGFHAISLQSDTVVGDYLLNELHRLVGSGRLILAGDNDVAGFKIMSEIQAQVKGSLLLRFPADTKDANDLWLKHNNNLPEFQRLIVELTDKALPAPEAAPEAPEAIIITRNDKEADRAEELGYGTKVWKAEHASFLTNLLSDKTVVTTFENPSITSMLLPVVRSLKTIAGLSMSMSMSADKLAAAISAAPERRQRLVVVQGNAFLKKIIPPREVLLETVKHSPILYGQSLNQIYAWRGMGKTNFTFGLVQALTTGGKFLNWQAQRPVRVLYVEGELPASQMQERLRQIVGETKADNLRIITLDEQSGHEIPSLAGALGQMLIEEAIGDAEVLVLDSISTLFNISTNEEENWLSIQNWMKKLRSKGVCIIFLHHAGKSGLQRGSSKSEDLLDISIKLSRPKDYKVTDGLRLIVEFDKIRGCVLDSDPIEVQMQIVNDTVVWTSGLAEDGLFRAACRLFAEEWTVREVAKELDVTKSRVGRWHTQYQQMKPEEDVFSVQ